MSGQETETASDEAFIRQSWMALLVLLPLPLLSEYSGLDVWIENYCFSPAMHGFPWRDVLWFNVLLHNGLRVLLVFYRRHDGAFAAAGHCGAAVYKAGPASLLA